MWYDFTLLIRMSVRHVTNYYITLVLLPSHLLYKTKEMLFTTVYLSIDNIELINFATISLFNTYS